MMLMTLALATQTDKTGKQVNPKQVNPKEGGTYHGYQFQKQVERHP
jgi:hypothetical protein